MSKTLKISTNTGNPVTLKPLIAANIFGLKIALENVNVPLEEKQRPRLPVLLAGDTTRLFDTNFMMTYIFEIGSGETPKDSTLNLFNYETHTIFPLLISYFTEKGDVDFGVGRELLSVLTTLQTNLQTHPFFSKKDKPGFEDALLFSTLYPLFASKDKLVSRTPDLVNWFEKAGKHDTFAAAVKLLKPVAGKEAIKVILVCNPTMPTSTHGEKYPKVEVKKPISEETTMVEDSGPEVSAEDIKSARVRQVGQEPESRNVSSKVESSPFPI